MKLLNLLEDRARALALTLQQELIDLLPDDYDVILATTFLHASQYNYGKLAVKVKHPSYTRINDGQVLIFPSYLTTGAVNSQDTSRVAYEHEYERVIIYDNIHELAIDLESNIQSNTI